MKKHRLCFALICSMLFLQACGGSSGGSSAAGAPLPTPQGNVGLQPTFSSIHANIIGQVCIACHNGPGGIAELDLTTYASIVAHKLVLPGDPDHSDLFIQVNTGAMPEGGPKLPSADIQAIHDWIADGAMDN
jgi:hypothetical protein